MSSVEKNRELRLLAVFEIHQAGIPQLQLSLQTGRTNERLLAMTEWGMNQIFSLKSFFLDQDIIKAKEHFFNCGMQDVLLTKKYDGGILDYGINHLSYALLSDSSELIYEYSYLTHSKFEKSIKRGVGAPVYIMQCILREDWNEFDKAMAIMKSKTVPRFKMELDYEFYKAIADKNRIKAEEMLNALLDPKMHKRRNKYHILCNEFISHPALGYAKLAWIKGLEVEIDNPLVPTELLPIRSNNSYVFRSLVSKIKDHGY